MHVLTHKRSADSPLSGLLTHTKNIHQDFRNVFSYFSNCFSYFSKVFRISLNFSWVCYSRNALDPHRTPCVFVFQQAFSYFSNRFCISLKIHLPPGIRSHVRAAMPPGGPPGCDPTKPMVRPPFCFDLKCFSHRRPLSSLPLLRRS